ncbi:MULTISPECIES: hypothetical protein [unclassified Ensifer]|uniref:hypothetical protein n=1 Tax=unclassified Ensifer TaxID=2633371 RepID=UPI00070A3DC8|nr:MULTISPECIES: hypothetical protein [unclassified Ensifer]KQW62884.1 hypothetical protein ASD02_01840 [Ensifer sp. Root1252]KRC83705.1 hypothetical protein ASE32_01830 [Ensifer sp. Root231]KRD04058.1 hypothetical protein ASE47_00490 [Ensifer sp. Root258]
MAEAQSPIALRAAFLDQGVKLPMRPSETDCGVVLDADDRDVFTVDSNGYHPDDQVKTLALLICACVNEYAGLGPENQLNG